MNDERNSLGAKGHSTTAKQEDPASASLFTEGEEQYVESRLRAFGVPGHLHGGLARYLVYGIEPGGFLVACLENNLSEAMGRADEISRAGLFEIVSFLYNDAPAPSWGSRVNVQAWMRMKLAGRTP